MPFLSQKTWPIPEVDILSWCFDDPQFDLTQPLYLDAQDETRVYTGITFLDTIRSLIAGFLHVGLKEDDCVCLHAFNSIDYPAIVNGIVGFGGVFAGTNPSYQLAELVHAIKTAEVKAFIVEPELLSNVLKAAQICGLPNERILILNSSSAASVPSGFKSWRTLLEHGQRDWLRFRGSRARSQHAARLFSSGTTGLPKSACLSHYNMIAQHCVVQDAQRKPYAVRRLMTVPFFHVAGVPSTHFSPARDGSRLYVMRRFAVESYLAAIERHKITDTPLVPPMVISIIMSPLSKKYSLRSLKATTCGAAPLDRGPQARFKSLLAEDCQFTQVWGMTETSCICTQFNFPEADDTGSVGFPVPGIDMKLVDQAGADITDFNVRGELCVRGPTVIAGYFRNEEANKRDFDKDGFFHTGDIAYCDRQTRKWYIVDRLKELIKVRSFQVAPPEIEGVLLSHPHIADAAVIGVRVAGQNGEIVELPRAYIVRKVSGTGDSKLSATDVIQHVRQSLAKYKWLEGGVRFLDAIPKNASGKILKRVLREMAQSEAESAAKPKARL